MKSYSHLIKNFVIENSLVTIMKITLFKNLNKRLNRVKTHSKRVNLLEKIATQVTTFTFFLEIPGDSLLLV